MSGNGEIINVDVDSADDRPVIIHCESGSTVTINVNIRNYYGYPEWFDRAAFDTLVAAMKREGLK